MRHATQVAIASALRAQIECSVGEDEYAKGLETAVFAIGQRMKLEDPRFDTGIWIEACGVKKSDRSDIWRM